jgi:capsular polysaccharide transport system ATP-binding protein
MIVIEDVYKRYMTKHGVGPWVLRGISLTIPAQLSVGLIGVNGSGKSTLLRLIGGVDYPNKGRVIHDCSISWPMGQGGLEGTLTGRQNAKFVCRIYGQHDHLPGLLDFILDFSELGRYFDEPVSTYSSGMRSRLQFALSLAIDFDVFISDEVTSAGDAGFKMKAQAAFKNMAKRSSLIMVSHSEQTLKEFCQAGLWLSQGQAYWFDDIEEAFKGYKDSLQEKP